MISKSEIESWFDHGVSLGARHMLVIGDTYDNSYYAIYTRTDKDCIACVNAPGEMQRVTEVYDLRGPKNEQLEEKCVMRLPALAWLTDSPEARKECSEDVMLSNPMFTETQRLQIARGAIMFRDAVIKTLRSRLDKFEAKPGTPAAQWRVDGERDPHAGHYDGERAALTLGKLTDDELANGAFMNYNAPFDIDAVLSQRPGYHPPIIWMTAVKDRIRWLSRALEKALEIGRAAGTRSACPEGWKLVPIEPTDDILVAGQEAWSRCRKSRPAIEDCEEAMVAYKAMLSAAPEAPR